MSMESLPIEEDETWTAADEIGEQWEEENIVRGGGGGGGKKKKKSQRRGKKTSKALQAELVGNSVEKRTEFARVELKKVLTSFPAGMRAEEEDRYYEEYVDWVNNRINQTQLNIEDEDFRIDSFIPGIHAGGQGMQTSRSGKRAVHLITNISAEMGKGGRSGAAKEMEAKKIALERLQSHLENWKTYLNGKDGELRDITPQDLFEVVVD